MVEIRIQERVPSVKVVVSNTRLGPVTHLWMYPQGFFVGALGNQSRYIFHGFYNLRLVLAESSQPSL